MERTYSTDIISLKKIMIDREIKNTTCLSEKSGINRNTLSKVLNGKEQPSISVMDKLVNTLEIEPERAGKIFFAGYLRNT